MWYVLLLLYAPTMYSVALHKKKKNRTNNAQAMKLRPSILNEFREDRGISMAVVVRAKVKALLLYLPPAGGKRNVRSSSYHVHAVYLLQQDRSFTKGHRLPGAAAVQQ